MSFFVPVMPVTLIQVVIVDLIYHFLMNNQVFNVDKYVVFHLKLTKQVLLSYYSFKHHFNVQNWKKSVMPVTWNRPKALKTY